VTSVLDLMNRLITLGVGVGVVAFVWGSVGVARKILLAETRLGTPGVGSFRFWWRWVFFPGVSWQKGLGGWQIANVILSVTMLALTVARVFGVPSSLFIFLELTYIALAFAVRGVEGTSSRLRLWHQTRKLCGDLRAFLRRRFRIHAAETQEPRLALVRMFSRPGPAPPRPMWFVSDPVSRRGPPLLIMPEGCTMR
jgi:hypothetical protein